MPHSVQLGNFKHTCYRLLPTGWVIQNLLTATSRGMKPLLICIEDAWKVSGPKFFLTKVCKYVSFQTKLFSDHKENPKENSSVALLSLTCCPSFHEERMLPCLYRYDRVRGGGGAAEDLYKLQKRTSGFLCGRNYNKMYQRRKVL